MSEIDEKESKHERFLRVGEPRVDRAVSAIGLLENLSSSAYEHTEEDARRMIGKIVAEVQKVSLALDGPVVAISEDLEDQDVDSGGETDSVLAPAPACEVFMPTDFPNREEGLELMRIGPMLGSCLEDLMDGNSDAALAKIIALLKA